jgi:hypothetical protein
VLNTHGKALDKFLIKFLAGLIFQFDFVNVDIDGLVGAHGKLPLSAAHQRRVRSSPCLSFLRL